MLNFDKNHEEFEFRRSVCVDIAFSSFIYRDVIID